jgi:hypothetical protein
MNWITRKIQEGWIVTNPQGAVIRLTRRMVVVLQNLHAGHPTQGKPLNTDIFTLPLTCRALERRGLLVLREDTETLTLDGQAVAVALRG